MREWMSDPPGALPSEGDNPDICVWGADGGWDVLCERCGYSASEIGSEHEADRVAAAHLADAHP
jgi:hypothetical protein